MLICGTGQGLERKTKSYWLEILVNDIINSKNFPLEKIFNQKTIENLNFPISIPISPDSNSIN